MFSIDDSSDFQADFVLATLLGSASASTENGLQQAETISANVPKKQPSSVRQRKNSAVRQNKVMQNGRGKRSINEEGPSHYNEDEWNHPFSIPARDLNPVHGREGNDQSISSRKSGPARTNSTSTAPDMAGSSQVKCGSVDEDVMMDGGCVEEGEREEGGDKRESGGVVQVSDPLDALFGEENMMDVAEEEEGGGGFGMIPQPLQASTTHTEKSHSPISGETQHNIHVQKYHLFQEWYCIH